MPKEITLGEHATNCAFDGSDLYVAATREAGIEASQRTGTFWRVETDTTGLDLIPGRLLAAVPVQPGPDARGQSGPGAQEAKQLAGI